MTSTGPMLAPLRPLRRSQPTESPAPTLLSTPVRLPKLQRVPTSFRRLLDFDLETVAAGFADPEWVPQTITAWAHTWDGNHVEVATLAVADFYNLDARRQFLAPLREAIRQADILTGHNITRFDLPVLNADLMSPLGCLTVSRTRSPWFITANTWPFSTPSRAPRESSVITQPGATPLTRMPSAA